MPTAASLQIGLLELDVLRHEQELTLAQTQITALERELARLQSAGDETRKLCDFLQKQAATVHDRLQAGKQAVAEIQADLERARKRLAEATR
jgi:chromosome segregation ATPase